MSGIELNRQARLFCDSDSHPELTWGDYGNVSLLEAARLCAIEAAVFYDQTHNHVWEVEVRCETSPEISIETYQVRTSLVAEILDPRKGSD
jgi:hypothetical protein